MEQSLDSPQNDHVRIDIKEMPASPATSSTSRASDTRSFQPASSLPATKGDGPRIQVPFAMALLALISCSVFLSCAAMFVPLELFARSIRSNSADSVESALKIQAEFVTQLIKIDVPKALFSRTLDLVAHGVDDMQMNADRALDAVWVQMKTKKRFDPAWSIKGADARKEVGLRAWAEVTHSAGNGLLGIYAVLHDGSFAGFSLNESDSVVVPELCGLLWDSPPGGTPLTSTVTELSTGRRSGTTLFQGQVNLTSMAQQHVPLDKASKARRMWSRATSKDLGLSIQRTAPLAYCGLYSCMEGILSAEVSFRHLSEVLHSVMKETPAAGRSLGNFFLIVQASPFSEQVGRVLTDAQAACATLQNTVDCPREALVDSAAQMLLKEFGSWNAPELLSSRFLNFSRSLQPCGGTSDCYLLGTRSIQLDPETRWLAVAVLPSNAFVGTTAEQDAAAAEKVASIATSTELVDQARARGRDILLVMLVLGIVASVMFSRLIAKPLRNLKQTMARLGQLDFTECAQLKIRPSSRRALGIREIENLQLTFCKLVRGISTFARFVPETVVCSIVQKGDFQGTRLEVTRRMVTIMCTDIKGFTGICERLRPRDLLYMLTRYFSVMMRVVELYGGVVSEILGDGLIVFWNAPDTVEDHAGKACAAALTQQEALRGLNGEYTVYELPEISIRIGIHTGSSLVGNIGSESKMKYGCLGDTKRVATKLEDLCKHYRVDIICSASSRNLTIASRFLFRQLDYVQVQQDSDPMTLYELISRDENDDGDIDIDSTRDAGSRYSLSIRDMASDAVTGSYSMTSASHLSHRSLPSIHSHANMEELVNVVTNRREMLHRYLADVREGEEQGNRPGECLPAACQESFSSRTHGSFGVTELQRRHIGQYERALKAFHEGRIPLCIELVQMLLAETDDPPAQVLLDVAKATLNASEAQEAQEETLKETETLQL